MDPQPNSDLLALRRHLTIAHHLPGRIRLRLTNPLLQRLRGFDTGAMRTAVGQLPGIGEIRINAAAATAVIHYDPTQLPSHLWEQLIHGSDDEAQALLTHYLRPAPPDTSPKASDPTHP